MEHCQRQAIFSEATKRMGDSLVCGGGDTAIGRRSI